MIRTAICLVAGSIMLAGSAFARGADKDSAAGTQLDPAFQQVYRQWQDALADAAQVQTKMMVGSAAEPAALQPKLAETVGKAESLVPTLQAAAEKSLDSDNANRDLSNLLYALAIGHLRKDNYEEALRLTNLLQAHQYPEKGLDRLGASAAFGLMKLDEAKKFLEAAAVDAPADDPDIKDLKDAIEIYRPKWEREQQLREAEAQADNLPRVKLHTSQGDIVLELFENEAPNTVANFISLVEKGFYDGTLFHRVLPGFMAQGGDPSTKPSPNNQARVDDGPGYAIADECGQANHREYFRGNLGMARRTPNTGGSQFFLTFAPTPELDGAYTVFGRVIDGMDVLSKIQRYDPSNQQPARVMLDKIITAEVLRKRDHPYEPKTLPKK